jgi:hypothetical protein
MLGRRGSPLGFGNVRRANWTNADNHYRVVRVSTPLPRNRAR